MNLIILFSRRPTLGQVKRRLARDIGDKAALEVHQWLFRRTLEVIAQSGIKSTLYLSAQPNEEYDYDFKLQEGKDLGERMAKAFQHEIDGDNRVCLIGSDCLDLSPEDLLLACEKLKKADLVLGPANDGGYYLIGLKQFYPELFKGIKWSSPEVFAETLVVASKLSLKTVLLEKRTDVDKISDLPANWKAF